MTKKHFTSPRVEKLAQPEHYGDWHDKPVRWNVVWGSKNQKFCRKKDALLYAKIWRRNGGDELKAIHEFQAP